MNVRPWCRLRLGVRALSFRGQGTGNALPVSLLWTPMGQAAENAPYPLRNHLDRHDAVNATARALTENGLAFVAARNLHHT